MTLLHVIFHFSDYVCTLVTNNIHQVCQLCTKKSANTFIALVHLTINKFFYNYQHLVTVFTAVGTEVGQVGTSAKFFGKMDVPAHQSLGLCLW